MNRHQAATLTRHRLNKWKGILDGMSAVPVLMLSISNAPETEGQIVLTKSENMSDETLAGFLRHTLGELQEKETT